MQAQQMRTAPEDYTFRLEYVNAAGKREKIYNAITYDPVTQQMYGNWKFEEYVTLGQVTGERVWPLMMRQTTRWEMFLLAKVCCFEVTDIYCGYDGDKEDLNDPESARRFTEQPDFDTEAKGLNMQPAENKLERSCGAVVFAGNREGRKYLLIRSQSGFWGFPKGHMEPGETEEETAMREVKEETGAEGQFVEGFCAREEDPLLREGRPDVKKRVTYFLARCEDGTFLPPDRREVAEARLMPYEEAASYVYSDSLRRILAQAKQFLDEKQMD